MVFKKEILKVSNEYMFAYMKKDTLFTEDSSDDDSNNISIPLNLTKLGDENEDDNFKTFTQNSTNIVEWTSPTT
jgi:hypothetical protein